METGKNSETKRRLWGESMRGELMTESLVSETTLGLDHLISSFCTNLVTFHSRECAIEVKRFSIAVIVM